MWQIHILLCRFCAQNRQSAKLFLQSSKLGLPHPPTRKRVLPPPLVPGGSLALRERGWGVPIRMRGQTLCYSRHICIYVLVVLCVPQELETRGNAGRQRTLNYFYLELCVYQLVRLGERGFSQCTHSQTT
jgi:hypothetical protein